MLVLISLRLCYFFSIVLHGPHRGLHQSVGPFTAFPCQLAPSQLTGRRAVLLHVRHGTEGFWRRWMHSRQWHGYRKGTLVLAFLETHWNNKPSTFSVLLNSLFLFFYLHTDNTIDVFASKPNLEIFWKNICKFLRIFCNEFCDLFSSILSIYFASFCRIFRDSLCDLFEKKFSNFSKNLFFKNTTPPTTKHFENFPRGFQRTTIGIPQISASL